MTDRSVIGRPAAVPVTDSALAGSEQEPAANSALAAPEPATDGTRTAPAPDSALAAPEPVTDGARTAPERPAAPEPAAAPGKDRAGGGTARVTVARAYRFELVKLTAQWRVRVLVLVCLLGPALFIAAVSRQSTLPTDTLFGRWMHATGWAGPLVVLGFAGTWALPLLTSLVAGDVFAAEDRLGTWRHLLVAVRSPRRIFAAKALAGLTVVLALVAGLAASSAVGGVAAVGNRPLVGLDGRLLPPPDAAGRVALAWVCALAPTLALAAIGLLGSIALGRSPMGLLLPALVALVMRLAQMLPLPVAVRLALPGYAFVAWNGLFTTPEQLRPLLIGITVSLVWAVAATALAYLLFLRRDFTNPAGDSAGRRALTAGLLPPAVLTALTGLTVAVLAVAAPATGPGAGIGQDKVQRSVATAFAHLYRLQTERLHRPAVTEAQLRVSAACAKGDGQITGDGTGTGPYPGPGAAPAADPLAGTDPAGSGSGPSANSTDPSSSRSPGANSPDPSAGSGPGNDWRCVVTWHLPGTEAAGTAVYQLDIASDGHYVADGDGPKDVNGYFLVRTPYGDAPNPLWQFDGTLDLLAAAPATATGSGPARAAPSAAATAPARAAARAAATAAATGPATATLSSTTTPAPKG